MDSQENTTIRKTQLQRRGLCIFTPMSVSPYFDEDTGSTTPTSDDTSSEGAEVTHVERPLPNGDFYMGMWYNDRPHGVGKYLWTDGCMYEGEWYKGKTMGRGKFSWPSGATYEGDFKHGFLDGYGTFTGASGDTYRGYYINNLKHGHGKRTYVNGDHYEGGWRRGLQDGQGRYVWKCGHEYTGSWRNGTIHGKGVLAWVNGNRYEGDWDDGAPCGKGQFRWADGSLYVGIWNKDPALRRGVYFPSGSSSAMHENLPRDPHDDLAVDLDGCRVCTGESVSILPSQKPTRWSAGGPDGATKVLQRQAALWASKKVTTKPRTRSSADAARRTGKKIDSQPRASCDGSGGSCTWDLRGEDGRDVSGTGGGREQQLTPGRNQGTRWMPKETKRQGETIGKGHKNYELMLNLQLGIRHSVGRPAPSTSLDLKASVFDPKEKVWTKFPPEGSKHTPPHQSCEFKWKDYCPVVFRALRKVFTVDPADYMLSICGNDALRELSSPGKSGSFFYLTHDDRYMIKTMKKSEVKVLLRMLPAYYSHVRAFENTLVTKFFGLHCVKLTGATQKKVRFVIMGNLFCSDYKIHRRFDLKGSSHGRTTDKPEAEIDETTTLKDLDLNFIFRLKKSWFQELHRQIDRDCDFLEQERIMDYSLLVGLHFRDDSNSSRDRLLMMMEEGGGGSGGTVAGGMARADMDQLLCDPTRWASMKLGANMPARAEQTLRRSDYDGQQQVGEQPTGDLYDVVLFFGIIDILQDYDISKKLEHAYKSIHHDPTSISAVDPRNYSRRFRDFVFRVFVEHV